MNLCASLRKLSNYDLHINRSKYVLFSERIEHLGMWLNLIKLVKVLRRSEQSCRCHALPS